MAKNYAVETVSSLPFGMLIGAPLTAAIEAQTQAAKATIDFILRVGFLPPNTQQNQLSDPNPVDITQPDAPVANQPVTAITDAGQTRMVTFSYYTNNPDPAVANLVAPARQAAAAARQVLDDGPNALVRIQALQTFQNPQANSPEATVLAAATAAAVANSTAGAVAAAILALIEQNATITVPLLSVVPIPFFSIDEMTIDFVAKITEAITASSRATAQSVKSASANASAGWGPVSGGFKAGMSSTHTSTSERSSKYQTELTMSIHVRASSESMPKGMGKVLDMLAGIIKSQ